MLESNETQRVLDPDRALSEIREETQDHCETSAARAMLSRDTNGSNYKSSLSSYVGGRGVGTGLINPRSDGKPSQSRTLQNS